MGQDIIMNARRLADQILESDEYQHFLECKQMVKDDGTESELNAFRREAFLLQTQGTEAYGNHIGELRDQYRNIIERACVREYLDAEIKLCRLLQSIDRILIEHIDIDVDFLG